MENITEDTAVDYLIFRYFRAILKYILEWVCVK